MDKAIEEKILGAYQAEQKMYEACPKMKDPSWWDGDKGEDSKLDEHNSQLMKELADKAGVEVEE